MSNGNCLVWFKVKIFSRSPALEIGLSPGFITVEEGQEKGLSIELRLQRIGRINFSHDLPVRKVIFILTESGK